MKVSPGDKKVILELLSSCNLNCAHCFYRQSSNFHSPDFLPKKGLLSLIDGFSKKGINKLVLTGGEPTLHPDFLEISRYAMSKIDRVTLCTNGYIVNKKLKEQVLELNFATYTVSIDSHIKEVHDDFRGRSGALDKTLEFLEELNKKGRHTSIHIVIHRNNFEHIEETIKFCKKLSPEIVVGSIYYDKLKINQGEIDTYNKNLEKFRQKYINDPYITLVGFEPYCSSMDCPDQKQIFMVNRKGQAVTCYWKKGGGQILN